MRASLLPALLLLLALSCGQALAGARPPAEKNTGADLRTMSERWMDPDLSRVSSFEGKNFGSTAAFARGDGPRDSKKQYNAKAFNTRGNFVTGEYYTKEWSKAKKGWGSSDRKFTTKAAHTDTGKVIPGTEEPYSTRNVEKKSAYDAGKTVDSSSSRDDQRPFLVKGTRQDQLDLQNAQRGSLTVEQVKELLNKSK